MTWTTECLLTNTNRSKLGGHQGAGGELVIGRNWSPVEEAVGSSRLERSWSGSSRGRAGAHGRLRRMMKRFNATYGENTNTSHLAPRAHLDDSRVLRQRACWFGRLTHSQVLDVAASKDDVLEGVVSRGDGSVCGPVLGAKGAHWGEETGSGQHWRVLKKTSFHSSLQQRQVNTASFYYTCSLLVRHNKQTEYKLQRHILCLHDGNP